METNTITGKDIEIWTYDPKPFLLGIFQSITASQVCSNEDEPEFIFTLNNGMLERKIVEEYSKTLNWNTRLRFQFKFQQYTLNSCRIDNLTMGSTTTRILIVCNATGMAETLTLD